MSRTSTSLTAPLIKVDRSVEPPDFEQSNKQRKVDDVEANDYQVQGTILESDKPPHSAHQIITTVSRSTDSLKDQESDRNRKNKVILIV